MKCLSKFTTKSGKNIEIWEPSMERLPALLEFVNRLVKEDTFLSFIGKPKILAEKESWLKDSIANMKTGRSFLVWAVFNDKVIGSSDIIRSGTRDGHVGKIGLMVDKDFRRDGVGRFLLDFILKKASQMKIKMATLDLFSDNMIAISLYQKLGFKEYGRLPNGLFRKNKYSDKIEMYKNL